MESDNDLARLLLPDGGLSTANRALRLRLALEEGFSDQLLLPQRVCGVATICGGFEYRILCVSRQANLALKPFIGIAAEVQMVTDRGELRRLCGIVTQAASGQSDGGLATYQLVISDALSAMDLRTNSRIFLGKNEIDIIDILLREWRARSADMAAAFEFEFSLELKQQAFPRREFTMQCDETDGAFIRRLLKRRGIAWFFRPGHARATVIPDDEREHAPVHTLVMFCESALLKENAAGAVRYHRADATEQRDTITAWGAVRTLVAGSLSSFSWDYADPQAPEFMTTTARSSVDQGRRGNRLAEQLNSYRIESPHVGDSHSDHGQLNRAALARHEYESKYFHGECNVRDLQVGEWISMAGHPEIDDHPDQERQFVMTSLRTVARNNLPKDLNERIERLFAHSRFDPAGAGAVADPRESAGGALFECAFTCVRRAVRIVPSYDPRVDVPRAEGRSVVVVGPEGERVHCDEQGRVKVRFPGMRAADHAHAQGAGASGTDADSAYVRVVAPWAGSGPGNRVQCGTVFVPRPNSEVWLEFVNGDPDRPIIVGGTYNPYALPPALSARGGLAGNRCLSGIRSGELGGSRGNQLCFDDTRGQINAQLASDHGASELNLGWLSEPRAGGVGAPRGEGAELRSDEYIALRAAKGMLLSAWRRIEGLNGATGKQLARDEYLALMRECSELFGALGQYAAEHEALAQDGQEQETLNKALRQWESGSNTEPKGSGGGAAVVGVTAPDGISFASAKAIVSYAATNVDTIAQQHLQMTAGQRFNLNVGKGISLFSHSDGIRAIAHYGKFSIQSQHDDININAGKNINITATGVIRLMAKEIHTIAEDGSFTKVGSGITAGSNDDIQCKAANFLFAGPATMAAELPTFGGGNPDQKFTLKFNPHVQGAIIAPNSHYEIAMTDGSVRKGISDAMGKTDLLQSEAMHIANVRILDRES